MTDNQQQVFSYRLLGWLLQETAMRAVVCGEAFLAAELGKMSERAYETACELEPK